MTSIERSQNYKGSQIKITFSDAPSNSHSGHHGHHMDMSSNTSNDILLPFIEVPRMSIKLKENEIDLNSEYHIVRSLDGRYFTHYFPYRTFGSPWELSESIIDSLITKDQITNRERQVN